MGKRKSVTLRTRKSTELECSDGKKEVPPGFQNLEPRWDKLPSTMMLTSVFSTYPVLCWDRETPILLLGMWGRNDWGKENSSTVPSLVVNTLLVLTQ